MFLNSCTGYYLGLKLELSSIRAHENMLILKCRLELESKSMRIEDLEQQIKSLQSEIHKLSYVSDSSDRHHETLAKELERARQRYAHLEEENRSTEERLKLAEDLQQNDRELLEVLRNQLSQLEQELQTSQQCNKLQEDKLKLLELNKGIFFQSTFVLLRKLVYKSSTNTGCVFNTNSLELGYICFYGKIFQKK